MAVAELSLQGVNCLQMLMASWFRAGRKMPSMEALSQKGLRHRVSTPIRRSWRYVAFLSNLEKGVSDDVQASESFHERGSRWTHLIEAPIIPSPTFRPRSWTLQTPSQALPQVKVLIRRNMYNADIPLHNVSNADSVYNNDLKGSAGLRGYDYKAVTWK